MMIQINSNKRDREIDAAWAMHKLVLHDACFDALAALLTILLGLSSFLHAVVRCSYAIIGMITWTFGMWIIGLQALRAYCIEHSSTSPFAKEVQADE